MNTPSGLDKDLQRHELRLQERALDEERRGVDAAASRGVIAKYRLISRALRQPPAHALPADFAARTAARAESMTRAADDRLELWIQRVLVALLIVAALATTVIFSAAARWVLIVAACLVLSVVAERLPRRLRPR